MKIKLCECGCGKPTPIAKQTNTIFGYVKGKPTRFIQSHHLGSSGKNNPAYRPLSKRFWEKVNKDGPLPSTEAVRFHPEIEGTQCWEWTGHTTKDGYGQITVFRIPKRSTHAACFLRTGKWPVLQVLHKCDNIKCVRTLHLFQGTHQRNMQDMALKGRAAKGENQSNAKLTQAQVSSIRMKGAAGETATSLSKLFGVSQPHVSRILLNQAWKEASV